MDRDATEHVLQLGIVVPDRRHRIANAVEVLTHCGIPYAMGNSGIHLQLHHPQLGPIDFWPTNDHGQYGNEYNHRRFNGLRKLIELFYLSSAGEAPESTSQTRTQPKGHPLMDKNLAALLREDTKTILVTFTDPNENINDDCPLTTAPVPTTAPAPTKKPTRPLTYVTHLDLAVGDTIVVPLRNERVVGYVAAIHEKVEIEPNSDTKYQWVIGKVDTSAHEANVTRNAEIEAKVAEAYQRNIRASFRQQVLAGLTDPASVGEINRLISGPGAA